VLAGSARSLAATGRSVGDAGPGSDDSCSVGRERLAASACLLPAERFSFEAGGPGGDEGCSGSSGGLAASACWRPSAASSVREAVPGRDDGCSRVRVTSAAVVPSGAVSWTLAVRGVEVAKALASTVTASAARAAQGAMSRVVKWIPVRAARCWVRSSTSRQMPMVGRRGPQSQP
jgi:hypothetical protein